MGKGLAEKNSREISTDPNMRNVTHKGAMAVEF
jgi:hypothetical protein